MTTRKTPQKAAAKKPARGLGRSASAVAERERLFVDAYIANGNDGAKAARTVGYSAKDAKKQAFTMLRRPNVVKALAERREKLAVRYELTTESVIGELSKIVHADPRRMFAANGTILPVKDWPDDVAGMVASIEVDELFEGSGKEKVWTGYTKKVKLWDKNSAIDKAMKHLGLFEKDNKQKTDPLVELLARVSGSALKPVED